MSFGAFDIFNFGKGSNEVKSNDPNSPNYAGGAFNKSYDDVKLRALKQYRAVNNRPLQFADESGFMPYQRAGMEEFARNLFSGSSGTAASRGMVMPQNYGAVVGSALTRALPNLFAIQNQNQFMPTQMAQERLGLLQPMIQAGGSSLGPGTGYQNINAANANWWQMMNNIGSAWGSMGTAGMKGAGGMG